MARARSPLPRRLAFWAVLLCSQVVLAAAADEHLPGKDEQYQGQSLKNFGVGSKSLWVNFKEALAEANITKAKVILGIGVLGALFTLNRNKRLFHWGVVAAISYALIALGALAIYKGWPSLNN